MAEPAQKKGKAPARRYTVRSNARYIFSLFRKLDSKIMGVMTLNSLADLVTQFVPVILPRLIIDELSQNGREGRVILLAAVFGAALLVSNWAKNASAIRTFYRMVIDRMKIQVEGGRKFMTMAYETLENPDVLNLAHKQTRAVIVGTRGVNMMINGVRGLITKGLALLGLGGIISLLNPLIALAITALLLVNFAAASKTRALDKIERDKTTMPGRKVWHLFDTMADFNYAKDIRLYGMKALLSKKMRAEYTVLAESVTRVQRAWLATRSIAAAMALLQEIVLYGWLCYSMLYRGMSVGEFIMYAAAIRTFSGAVSGLLEDISVIWQENEMVSDVREFLEYPDKASGSDKLEQSLFKDGITIEFNDVSFKYPSAEKHALKNISLKINAGERLAIVGLNGAGKTTFVKLLTKLYDPTSGKIFINGKDIAEYDRVDYFRLFSVVFQEINLFAFPVSENIAMTLNDKMDYDAMKEAARRAGIEEKIESLGLKYDQPVVKIYDNNAVEFSGGEKQKLALARALYKNAPVLVLDEPTSALDALMEEKIYKEFDKLTENKTAVYISHRLASTQFCDRIAVFEGGALLEQGTHSQLMDKNGRYAELFNIQAQYYRDEEAPQNG